MLNEELNELDDELEDSMNEDEIKELNLESIMRDLLDQNVETQHLPSEKKFDVLEGEGRNATYRLKDEQSFTYYDKSCGEYKTILGKDFNEFLIDEFDQDYCEYSHGEPNFDKFEISIHRDDIIDEDSDCVFEGHGLLNENGRSTERYGTNGRIHEAIEIIARELECEADKIDEYIKDNNLVIHEKGFGNEFSILPSEIHKLFSHTGTIGLNKDLQALSKGLSDTFEDGYSLLNSEEQTVEDLSNSPSNRYRSIKHKSISI